MIFESLEFKSLAGRGGGGEVRPVLGERLKASTHQYQESRNDFQFSCIRWRMPKNPLHNFQKLESPGGAIKYEAVL